MCRKAVNQSIVLFVCITGASELPLPVFGRGQCRQNEVGFNGQQLFSAN